MGLLGSILGSVVGAAGNVIGGIAGAKVTKKVNEQNIAFQREMWDKQVAYADKQQAHIEAYNDPAAQRARLEAAGYNPYLKDGNEIGAVSAPSAGNVSLSDPGPTIAKTVGSLGQSFADIYNTLAQADKTKSETIGQNTSNKGAAYNLQKQIDNDNVTKNGVRSYFSSGRMSIFQADGLEAQANLTSAQAATQKLLSDYNAAPAVDESGNPILDENGQPVNNLSAREHGNTLSTYKMIDKVNAEIVNAAKTGKLLDVDLLIKRFDLNETMPQMLENLRITAAKLNSEIMVNRAQKQALLASAYATRQQGLTTEYLRPHVLGKAFNDAVTSEYDADIRSYDAARARGARNIYDTHSTLGKGSSWSYFFGDPLSSVIGAAGSLLKFVK